MNKVAIITGGVSCIGKTKAKLLLEKGTMVMLVELDEKSLQEATDELGGKNVNYLQSHFIMEWVVKYSSLDSIKE